jgi:hypothetical protein
VIVNVAFELPLVTVIVSPLVYPVPAVTIVMVPAYPLSKSPIFTLSPVPVPPVVARLDVGFNSQDPELPVTALTPLGMPLGTVIDKSALACMLPGSVRSPYLLNVQLRVPEIPMVNVTLDAKGAPFNGPFVTVITSPGVYPVPGVFILTLA